MNNFFHSISEHSFRNALAPVCTVVLVLSLLIVQNHYVAQKSAAMQATVSGDVAVALNQSAR